MGPNFRNANGTVNSNSDGKGDNKSKKPWVRPQLGPETVPVLREWLLSPEHVDSPYPNQRETEAIMQRTGLDKTQLKHWFINARKRIFKP
ncbi:hypothetical protein ACHAWF_003737, partial [Thalassiosira exigua]